MDEDFEFDELEYENLDEDAKKEALQHYRDNYRPKEDWLMERPGHPRLLYYLSNVLRFNWWSRGTVYQELKLSQLGNADLQPLTADIAMFDWFDLEIYHRYLKQWCVGQDGPPPQIVFEIADEETWRNDLREKPTIYGQLGVEEYFVYDLHKSSARQASIQRLFGWKFDKEKRKMQEMTLTPDGRLWSECLEVFLQPDNEFLRLYKPDGQQLFTAWQTSRIQQELENARLAKLYPSFGKSPELSEADLQDIPPFPEKLYPPTGKDTELL